MRMAPPTGLEPVTPWLTVRCSTDWAMEECVLVRDVPYSVLLLSSERNFTFSKIKKWASCVGIDLSSRLVAKQVSSALQSLTSVFGMGTGGPSALEWPTLCQRWPIFPTRRQVSIFGTAELNFRVRNGNGWTLCVRNTDLSIPLCYRTFEIPFWDRHCRWCTFRDSNPGPTD